MHGSWVDLDFTIKKLLSVSDLPEGPVRQHLIKAFYDGAIRTRWHGHYRGLNPQIPKQEWLQADIDSEYSLVKSDGVKKASIQISGEDFEHWLAAFSEQKPAKQKTISTFARADASLLEEMARLVESGNARSVNDAARLVAEQSKGAGTIESRQKRLARAFSKQG